MPSAGAAMHATALHLLGSAAPCHCYAVPNRSLSLARQGNYITLTRRITLETYLVGMAGPP
jgi:hypothetical protein